MLAYLLVAEFAFLLLFCYLQTNDWLLSEILYKHLYPVDIVMFNKLLCLLHDF